MNNGFGGRAQLSSNNSRDGSFIRSRSPGRGHMQLMMADEISTSAQRQHASVVELDFV